MDTTAPSFIARPAVHRGVLTFELSEAAHVEIELSRARARRFRPRGRLAIDVTTGPVMVRLDAVAGRRLRRGRYRVTLRAADAAGNAAPSASVRFRVRR